MDRKKFSSRAGEKLEYALKEFNISIRNKICADLGCSTGGFTSCLLENGASKVYAVDTGYGVLAWKLRNNPKVVVMEKNNALYVVLPEPVDFISIDVGWTPQKLIVPKALSLLKPNGVIVSLVKPQYEAGPGKLRGGKIPDEEVSEIVSHVQNDLERAGVEVRGVLKSPIQGKKGGNVEFLFFIVKSKDPHA